MGTIKVTFYNNNKLVVNDIPSDSSGIYFQPADEINNKQLPAHIVHNGHFYTYGSYVIDNFSENINYTNSYVITDIESDQYNKTLTVKKQKLDLSGLEQKIENVESNFNTLCGSTASLKLGNEYNITIRVNDKYNFELLSDELYDPSCKIKINTNGTYTNGPISYNLSTSQATIYIGDITDGAKVNEVTVSSSKFTTTTTPKLSDLLTVNDNNTITIKNVGWADNLANSYSFGISVKLGPKDPIANSNINNFVKTFTCTLSKISSTATPTTQTLTLNENKQTISTLTILNNITPASAQITYNVVNTDKLEIINNNELKFKNGISTYSFSAATTNFQLTYAIKTSDTDIYYNTSGTINGTVTASKWRVNFNSRGTTVKTSDGYYNTSVTFPTKPADYTENNYTYTFDSWKDSNGTKYTDLKFGQTGVNFGTTYTLTLTAGFNATQQTKYYWYVGTENPANMTSISPVVSDNSSPGWRYIGTSKPTSSTFTSTNMLWNGDTNNISFGERIISYIAIPYKPLQMWDVTGGDGLFYTIQNNGNPVNINGVDYYVYMSDYKTAAFTMNIYNK